MLKKLRFKFVLVNMLIVTVMLCVIFTMFHHFITLDLERSSISMMQSIIGKPNHLNDLHERPEDVRLPYFTLRIDGDGEITAAGGGYYDLSDEAFLSELAEKADAAPDRTGVLEEYNLRFLKSDTPFDKCVVFADTSSEQATLRNLVLVFVYVGGASFIVFLIISILLSRWAVKPVETAWKQQRQFIADASHELKTPLTVILTDAELLQSPEYDDASRARFSSSILTMARQMRGLVEQLLELARADNAREAMTFSRVDYSKLITDASLSFEAVFYEKGLSYDSEIDGGIAVNGGETPLRQMAEVLLDNAQKYSSPGGAVRLTLKRQGRGRCLLTVSNSGEPISQEDLKNIFKRFYRVDKARTRDGGFGLGLSIAERAVSEHKGRIWAESADGVNSFKVELPIL